MTGQHHNRITAFSITLFLHLLLVTFLFLFILKTPIPPFGGGQGVVLNLGYVDEGTGEVQTLNNANESPVKEENKPVDEPVPNEANKEKDNSDPDVEEGKLLTSDEESEIKTDKKTEQEDENQKKNQEIIKKNQEDKKEPSKVNPNALFGGQTGTSNKGGNNNGDKEGKVGDQGNPQGDINAKALYGKMGTGGDGNGGSGGASLDLAGWRWEQKPKVKDDNEDENGRIVFQITIDEQGEIVSIKTLEKTVSPAVEKLYRDEVEKLSFIKTDNKIPALTSTGKITFIIRAR